MMCIVACVHVVNKVYPMVPRSEIIRFASSLHYYHHIAVTFPPFTRV